MEEDSIMWIFSYPIFSLNKLMIDNLYNNLKDNRLFKAFDKLVLLIEKYKLT